MIVRAKGKSTAVKVGQWVNLQSKMHHGLCGNAVQVASTSASGILFRRSEPNQVEGEPSKPSGAGRDSIVFVSDTKEEADALHALSEQHFSACRAALRSIGADFEARIAAMVTDPVDG
jgi:hypothetical protein